ncbi:MAG: hypothetical protein AABY33_08680 [Pseudomonadota bacterium]
MIKLIIHYILVAVFGGLTLIVLYQTFCNLHSLLKNKSLNLADEDGDHTLRLGTDNKAITKYLLAHFCITACIATALYMVVIGWE